MNKAILGCLTPRHLLLFGTIVQLFARYELLMLEVMATVAGADPAAIMLMTRSLDFSGKRHALLGLLYHSTIPADQYDRIGAFLMVPHEMTPLRNDIAHSAWISDRSESWIQPDWILRPLPRIKPLHDDPSANSEKFIERNNDEATYTLEGLEDTVNSLAANYERFSDYLRDTGLVGEGRKRASDRHR